MNADLRGVPEARAFALGSGATGCVLVHGITSTPHTMRPMGESLARAGIAVRAPLLAGHGVRWQDLERTTWGDWYGSVEAAYAALRGRCRRVYAAGLSLGGALALHLAAHHPELDGVIAMNPVLYLKDWRLPFLPLFRRVRRCLPAIAGDLQDPRAQSDISYDRTPLASVAQLVAFMRHLEDDLPQVRCPALVLVSALDHIVPPGNGPHVLARIGSRRRRLVTMRRSSHVMTLDWEQDRVFALARAFLRAGGRRARRLV